MDVSRDEVKHPDQRRSRKYHPSHLVYAISTLRYSVTPFLSCVNDAYGLACGAERNAKVLDLWKQKYRPAEGSRYRKGHVKARRSGCEEALYFNSSLVSGKYRIRMVDSVIIPWQTSPNLPFFNAPYFTTSYPASYKSMKKGIPKRLCLTS